jgi:hypothetical protein
MAPPLPARLALKLICQQWVGWVSTQLPYGRGNVSTNFQKLLGRDAAYVTRQLVGNHSLHDPIHFFRDRPATILDPRHAA